MNEEFLKLLYGKLPSKTVPYEEFKNDIQNPEFQKLLYDKFGFQSKNIQFEDFQRDLGYSPEQTTQPVQIASQEEPQETGSYGTEFIKSIPGLISRGATEFVPSIMEVAAAGESLIGSGLRKLGVNESTEPLFGRAAKATREFIQEGTYVDPEVEQSIPGQVVTGAGQILPFIATMGASAGSQALAQAPKVLSGGQALIETGKAIGKQAVKPAGVIGGSMVAGPEWVAAKEAGLSDEAAFSAMIQNYAVGQTEIIPIEKSLKFLNTLTGNRIMNAFKTGATGFIQEAIQEGFQTYLTNMIAQENYDPERDPMFGVVDAMLVGGLVGQTVGTVAGLAKTPEAKLKLQNKLKSLEIEKTIKETASTNNPEIDGTIDQAAKEAEDATREPIEDEETIVGYKSIDEVPEGLRQYAKPVEGGGVRVIALQSVINKATEDAFQKQSATQVPVQPEAGVSETVVEEVPDTQVTTGAQETAVAETVTPEVTAEVATEQPTTVSDLVGRRAKIDGEIGMVMQDEGGKMTFETADKIIELQGNEQATEYYVNVQGNKADISGETFEVLSINRDNNDNVVSVTLKTEDGRTITRRDPEVAMDIAIAQNNQAVDSRSAYTEEQYETEAKPAVKVEFQTVFEGVGIQVIEAMPEEVADTFVAMEAGAVALAPVELQEMVVRASEWADQAKAEVQASRAPAAEKAQAIAMLDKFNKDLNRYYEKLEKQRKANAAADAKRKQAESIGKAKPDQGNKKQVTKPTKEVAKKVEPKKVEVKQEPKKPEAKRREKARAKRREVTKQVTKPVVEKKVETKKPEKQVTKPVTKKAEPAKAAKPAPKKAEQPKVTKKAEPQKPVETKKPAPVEPAPLYEIKTYDKKPGMKTFTAPDSKSTIYFRESQADNNMVVLENIETPEEVRKSGEKGNAGRLLDNFLAYMDKRGKKITLVVSPRTKDTSFERLWDWYSKKGFKAQVINGYESDFEMERKAKKISVKIDDMIKGLKATEKTLDKARKKKGDRLKSSILFGMEADIAYYGVKATRLALQAGKTIAEAVQTGLEAVERRLKERGQQLKDKHRDDFLKFMEERATQALDPQIVKIVNKFNESGPMLGAQFEELPMKRKAMAVEVSNFIRDNVYKGNDTTNRTAEQLETAVTEFVDVWNQMALGRSLNKSDINAIVEKMAAPKRVQPFEGETQTIKVNDLIKELTRHLEKGLNKGFKRGQKYVNAEIDKIRKVLKVTNLSPRQTAAILNKIKNTNFYSPGSTSDLNQYIDDVVNNKEYADKLGLARKINKKLNKLGKSTTSSLPARIREVALGLSKIGTKPFETPKKIEEYLAMADDILAATKSVGTEGYRPLDATKINNFINNYRKEQERQYLKDLGNFTQEELDKMLEEEMESDKLLKQEAGEKAKELHAKMVAIAKYSGQRMADVKGKYSAAVDEIIDVMLNAPFEEMQVATLANYTRVADNIALNGDISGHGQVTNRIKASQAVTKLIETRKEWQGKVAGAISELRSVPQIVNKIFLDNRFGSEFMALTGIQGILDNDVKTHKAFTEKTEELEKAFAKIDRKYSGGFLGRRKKPSVNKSSEQIKMLVLSELGKYYGYDQTSHIKKVEQNILDSIEMYKKSDLKEHKRIAEQLQEVWNKYKDVKSAEDARKKFQQRDPHVFEAVEWMRENIFTPEFSKQVLDNTNNIHNRLTPLFNNYLPTVQTKLRVKAEDTKQAAPTGSIKPQMTAHAIESRRALEANSAYTVSFINATLNAYKKTLFDVKTSSDTQLFYYAMGDRRIDELTGGLSNTNYVVNTMKDKFNYMRGGVALSDSAKSFNYATTLGRNLGAVIALGGMLDQAFGQYTSALVASIPLLGSGAKYLPKAMWLPDSFIEGVIKEHRIGQRSARIGGTQFAEDPLLSESVSKLEDVTKFSRKVTGVGLYMLTKADTAIARQTWTAYYLKRLEELGVDMSKVDLATEGSKQKEESRKLAASFADNMVTQTQVASSATEMSKMAQARGWGGIIRNTLFAFSTFAFNAKIRFIDSIAKIKGGNKAEGLRELASVTGETVYYAAFKTFMAPLYISMLASFFREFYNVNEPPEEPEDDKDGLSKEKKKFFTMISNDVIPFAVGLGQDFSAWAINALAYKLFEENNYESYEEYMKEHGGYINVPLEGDYANLGVFGVGIQKGMDVVDAMSLWNQSNDGMGTVRYKGGALGYTRESDDIKGLEPMIRFHALWEFATTFAPIPRELRQAERKVFFEQLKDANPKRQGFRDAWRKSGSYTIQDFKKNEKN